MSEPESAKLNLDLLIKLMGMTTSANDAEALVAIRKANVVLQKFGGSWRDLLLSKVKIIEDPFVNLQVRPTQEVRRTPAPPPPPPPPKPQAQEPSWRQQYQANPQQYAPPPSRKKQQRVKRNGVTLDELA